MGIKVVALSGSLRKQSYNGMLVMNAANGARRAGAEVQMIELSDFDMPLFNEDVEAKGTPAGARRFKDVLLGADAMLIASPEYNSSVTAALKNAIDWASRPASGEAPLACFAGKVAGIMAASPGGLGGLRGLVHLRAILGNIQTLVIPDQFALAKSHEAFDASGVLKDEKTRQVVEGIGARAVEVARKLKG